MNLLPLLPVTYGYARVSKSDDDARNLDTQLRLLTNHGIREDLIFTDVASGRTMNRTGWLDLMGRVQPGDTIVVGFLDRFSRNFEEGVRIQAELTGRDIASSRSGRTSTPAMAAPQRSSSGARCWPRAHTRWTRPANGSSWGWTGPGPAGSESGAHRR